MEKFCKFVTEDRRIVVLYISDRIDFSNGARQRILREDVNMRSLSAKLVLLFLTNKQKYHQLWPIRT
jgi:hypothetical protein